MKLVMVEAQKKYAVFFLNTGRCGSQFFASKLAEVYPDFLRADHEPFQREYQPRHYFSRSQKDKTGQLSDVLEKHFQAIEETLEGKHYVETGWPVYGIRPYVLERFKGRVKVVHLYRHPVKVAASSVTHMIYNRGEWTDTMFPTPSDFGVKQSYLAGDSWDKMDDFSKALFWWTELHRFSLDLKKKCTSVPWLPLRFEDVFAASDHNALSELARFLELPEREEFLRSPMKKVDNFRMKMNFDYDIQQVENFQETLSVMRELGYAMSEIELHEILNRYHSKCPKIANKVVGALRRIKRLKLSRLLSNQK